MVAFTVFKGSKGGKIIKSQTTREVGCDDVLIKVTHSGVCGTDQHHREADMVLGHEGAGIVEDVGSSVKTLQKGDSVGWGYQHDCCGQCKQCLTGRETMCPERKSYGRSDLDQGSFATYGVWKAAFVFKIPSSIPGEHVAPLMCGGATVFNVLQKSDVKSTDVVGVIGVGGLGHLAIQFAAKMGPKVIVFSASDSKEKTALDLGATKFVNTSGAEKLQVSSRIDHLLVTTSQQPNWRRFLPIMAPGGGIYPLTVSKDNLDIPYMPIIGLELKIQGYLVAPRQVQRDMLEFAAQHQIKPITETFPMTVEGIETCMQKLDDGKMRYRGVLVT